MAAITKTQLKAMNKASSILIKNANIITGEAQRYGDIFISDGIIKQIDDCIQIKTTECIEYDARGKYVIPGGIDPHVHLDLPTNYGLSSDSFETGSIAALFGGTTTIIDFVTPGKNESLIAALEQRQSVIKNCYCDYALHMSFTSWQNFYPGEIETCIKEEGIPTFKIYLAYKDSIGIDDEHFFKVLEELSKHNAMIMIHAENGDLIKHLQHKYLSLGLFGTQYHAMSRPDDAEAEAVFRSLTFSKYTNCPVYFVHISTEKALRFIAAARNNGQKVWAETCPHYLMFNESCYKPVFGESAKFVMSPPLRAASNNQALWEGLKNKTIDVLATDHCPFHYKGQKEKGETDFTKIPNGVGGIEHRLQLSYTYGVLQEKISMLQWVQLNATNPAKIFGLYPQKGIIAEGSDADIVIWNPQVQQTISANNHHQHCDHNIYENIKITGNAETVILRGIPIIENQQWIPKKSFGKFVFRNI